jgi:putative transposase
MRTTDCRARTCGGAGRAARLGRTKRTVRRRTWSNVTSGPPPRPAVGGDLTRIMPGEGVLWLARVRDAFANRIVGWATDCVHWL